MKDERLEQLLRQGPPEEATYRAPVRPRTTRPGVQPVSGTVSFRQRDAVGHRSWHVAGLGAAAAVVALVGAVGYLVLTLANPASRLGPAASGEGQPSPVSTAAAGLASATVQPSISPAESPAPKSPPSTSAVPGLTADGWPLEWPNEPGGVFDANGTFYSTVGSQVIAIDASGHMVPGWPIDLPISGEGAGQLTLAPGGGILVSSNTAAAAVDESGRVRPGWPVAVDPACPIAAPDGDLVAVDVADGHAIRLVDLRLSGGDPIAWTWQPPQPTQPIACPVAVGTDGTIHVVISDASGSRTITTLSADGRPTSSGVAISGWDHIAFTPSGEAIAWRYVTTGSGVNVKVQRTVLALLGPAGTASPGWPVTLEGAASAPAFGADGSIVLSVGASADATGTVVVLGRNGSRLPGWPASMPAGAAAVSASVEPQDPWTPQSPLVAPDGTIYVAAAQGQQALIAAFGTTGRSIDGWPCRLGELTFGGGGPGVPGGPPLAPVLGSTGLLFVAESSQAGDSVTAIGADGRTVSGWPVQVAAGGSVFAIEPLADGGIEVESSDSSGPTVILARYLPNGQLMK